MLENFPNRYYKWFILGGLKNGFAVPRKDKYAWPFNPAFRQRRMTEYKEYHVNEMIMDWVRNGTAYEVTNPSVIHLQPIHVIAKGSKSAPRGFVGSECEF